jgi:hypothetical protein
VLTSSGPREDEATAPLEAGAELNARALRARTQLSPAFYSTAPPRRGRAADAGARVAPGVNGICAALGVAVPNEPFPHVNSTAEFGAMQASRADQPGS